MRTFGNEKNYAVWDGSITETLLWERTTGTKFPINPDEVIPRYLKNKAEQKSRAATKGEVFTPYEIIEKMNNALEADCPKIILYIKRKVLEATCGEAPFLTTRYDAVSGKEIPVDKRVGLLDRKLRAIPKEVGKDLYIRCADEALKASYGYEWQYDSLFLARRNLLMTTIEHYESVWGTEPDYETVLNWANIISYNIIRMDGITMCVPETEIPALVMDWEKGEQEIFGEPVKKEKKKKKRK